MRITPGRTATFRVGDSEFAPSFDISKPYAVEVADNRYADFRFEVRLGDRYIGDGEKPRERSELAASAKVPVGEVWGIYDELFIPAGQTPNNPKAFNTLVQVHAGPQMTSSPPFAMLLDYDDVTLAPFLKFTIVQRTISDGLAKLTEVVRANIAYNSLISILVRGMCSANKDGGLLQIWVNGVKVYGNDKVPMGYAKSVPEPDYAKFGIYRGQNGGPPLTQPLVVYHRNFKFDRWLAVQAYTRRKPWR